jgi:hypothetical protein
MRSLLKFTTPMLGVAYEARRPVSARIFRGAGALSDG